MTVDLLWLASSGALTIDDLPTDVDGVRLELIDGSLSVTPLGDADHQHLVLEYAACLRTAIPEGLRAYPGINVVRGPDTLLIPDVAVADPGYITPDRRGVTPEGLRFVIEITSPSTRRRDLTIKRELYREWNVPYLIVDRSQQPFELRAEGDLPPYARVAMKAVSGVPGTLA